MPKIKIDYSNTIFYKIYCKDTSVKELYIGHTTNFVQRKYAHKQGCINDKSANYKCKLYNVMRNNLGWDNWNMTIIAFHNCEDLYSAKKQEQQYFEEYNATLNSIEPLPPQNPIAKVAVKPTREVDVNPNHFVCSACNYSCSKKGDYNRHLLTRKHNNIITSNTFTCGCGKSYKHRQNLYTHKKTCTHTSNPTDEVTENGEPPIEPNHPSSLIVELLKQNHEFKDLIIDLVKDNREFKQLLIDQNKQMMEMAGG